jgi:mannose-6-phosphate isomerase-like protein (cupin superfamily)
MPLLSGYTGMASIHEHLKKGFSMDTIHVTRASEGRQLLVGADLITVKANSSTTAGSMLVFETRVLPGGGPPMLHRHGYSEVFYFLGGTFEIQTLNADNRLQKVTISAGDSIAIPSMVWHNFKNVGSTPGTFLAIHCPPVMEGLLEELGQPVDDPSHLPVPEGPPSPEEMERFMRIIGKYMELLPPEAISPNLKDI